MGDKTFWGAAVLTLALANLCDSAKILAIFSVASPSHHIFNSALMLELVKRGHDVTVFSADALKKPVPNYRDIVFEDVYEHIHEVFDLEAFAEYSHYRLVSEVFSWGIMTCEMVYKSNGGRQLLELTKNETFDLIIVEALTVECLLGYVSKFGNPPFIAITAYASPPWANELMGNFQNPSYVNAYTLPLTDHMTFMERMQNFLLDTYISFYRKYVFLPQADEISREFFGDSVPPASEIEKNTSFVMVNTHFSTDHPQPLVPGIIQIGGLQAKPAKPLPKHLKDFLDSASDGVIYMSLGSNIRSDKLNDRKRRAFLEAFSELPYKVLWKWESDSLPGQPPNVKIMKWVPQNDVLAHPNVRVFISHGGMLSTTEAVYHGVPVVGVPFIVDQYSNLRKNVARGVAVELNTLKLTKQSVLEALNKILKDPSYMERMKKLSAIYRDRPQTALETAVYWTEYALRHQGAPHLRCASLDLAWYQRHLLDVLAALLLVPVAVVALLWIAVKKLASAVRRKHEKVKKL